jgi:uncharacterized membrane protein YdbT with pleckstrin-like domain
MKTQLKKDEKVILEIRQHWFVLVAPTIILLIGIILGSLLIVNTVVVFGILIILIVICYFIYKVFQRKNNLWIVTNLRVIDEYGVFSNNAKESPLDKLNNVSYNQSFFGKIFGYGNVQIQTAAEIGSTTYHMVEHPKKLKDTITNAQEEYKHSQIMEQAAEFANAISPERQTNKIDIATELERLFELKQKGILTEEEYNARKAKILNS